MARSTRGILPAAGEGKRGREGYLAYLLRQANAATRLALDRVLVDLNVTSPQFSALVMIGSYQPLSSAELARLTLLTPQTINVIVRNLDQRGAIKRTAHQVHRRILTLELSEEGRRLLVLCRTRAARIDACLEKGLATDAERKAVRRWLSYIATQLGPTRDKQAALRSPRRRS